jgi:hypothetical protein
MVEIMRVVGGSLARYEISPPLCYTEPWSVGGRHLKAQENTGWRRKCDGKGVLPTAPPLLVASEPRFAKGGLVYEEIGVFTSDAGIDGCCEGGNGGRSYVGGKIHRNLRRCSF